MFVCVVFFCFFFGGVDEVEHRVKPPGGVSGNTFGYRERVGVFYPITCIWLQQRHMDSLGNPLLFTDARFQLIIFSVCRRAI